MKFSLFSAAIVPAPPGTLPPGQEGRRSKLQSYIFAFWKNSNLQILALTDQAVVSATSFLTSWMIGRFAGASQLGAYAIGVSVLASIFTIQGSLISAPYSIQRHRTSDTPAEHAGSTLVMCGILSAAIGLLLMMFALVVAASGALLDWLTAIFAIAAVVPFAVSRDFLRRFTFTHLQMANALRLDSCVAAVQLLVLAWLSQVRMLSTATAFIAIGLSCAIATIVSLYQIRSEFYISLGRTGAAIRQSWSLGKWLVIAQVMINVQAFITYWISLLIAGPAATGVYAACMTIVSTSNPIVNGLSNLLLPSSVLAWTEKGGVGLRRKAIRDCILLAAVMAPFCVVVAVAGESLLHFLYPASEYAGHGRTAAVLAFATLAFALGMPASSALASMEQPKSIFAVNTFGALLSIVLVFSLTVQYGIFGAAYGWLLSNIAVSACLWLRLLVLVSRSVDGQDPIQVLRDFQQDVNSRNVEITRLGEGGESYIYAVRTKTGEPICEFANSVIFKIYKPNEPTSLEEVRRQFVALTRLNEKLDGLNANHWNVSVPKPLHICESPLALVMTAVPGTRDLKSGAATDDELNPKALDDLAQSLTLAMQQMWSYGLAHGDLGLQNILYDLPSKSLCLIDPGTDECCQLCTSHFGTEEPARLELGHMVRDLGTDIKDLIGNPIARLRREIFVASIIRTYLGSLQSSSERRRALDEIRVSAKRHLLIALRQLAFYLRPFTLFLEGLVTRRIDSFLDRLLADSEI